MVKIVRKTILDFIIQFQKEKGYSPSVREIGQAVYLASSSTVHGHLKRMEKDGLIKWHGIRSIEIVGEHVSDEVIVTKTKNEVPTVIEWQGRRYVYEPVSIGRGNRENVSLDGVR